MINEFKNTKKRRIDQVGVEPQVKSKRRRVNPVEVALPCATIMSHRRDIVQQVKKEAGLTTEERVLKQIRDERKKFKF